MGVGSRAPSMAQRDRALGHVVLGTLIGIVSLILASNVRRHVRKNPATRSVNVLSSTATAMVFAWMAVTS